MYVSSAERDKAVLTRFTGPASTPHSSVYPWSWLQEHSYDPPARPKVEGVAGPE